MSWTDCSRHADTGREIADPVQVPGRAIFISTVVTRKSVSMLTRGRFELIEQVDNLCMQALCLANDE